MDSKKELTYTLYGEQLEELNEGKLFQNIFLVFFFEMIMYFYEANRS